MYRYTVLFSIAAVIIGGFIGWYVSNTLLIIVFAWLTGYVMLHIGISIDQWRINRELRVVRKKLDEHYAKHQLQTEAFNNFLESR